VSRSLSLALGIVTTFALLLGQRAAAQDAIPREELKAKTTYSPKPFEMTVRPPIKVAGSVLVEGLKFPSPYESTYPGRNDTVHARLYRVAEPKNAAIIALGGWRFDPLTPELARNLALSGIQVVHMDLPFQRNRIPKGKKSGELTLSSDLIQNERSFVQLALDVERLVDWLVRERKVDKDKIGVLGTSLGGFAAATLYGMKPDRFHAVAAQLAGADVAKVLFNGNWLTRHIRAALIEQGLTEREVRQRIAGMNPGTWAEPKRRRGVLLVAAELDEIVPLYTIEDLKDRYGGAEMIVIPKARHRAADGLRAALPQVRKHFEKLLLGTEKDTATPDK